MTTAMTLTELIDRTGELSVSEAVAIVLALIHAPAAGSTADLREPYGPPTPDNVELQPDGSVVCTGSAATPAISELALLLQELLARSPKIPGGLQYAIGRALLEVEAPPFDSLDEFAHSIARFAGGDTETVLRALGDRIGDRPLSTPRLVSIRPAPAVPPPPPPLPEAIDRRLHGPRPDQLRRELRAADELLFTHTVVGKSEPERAPLRAGNALEAPEPARHGWRWLAGVAALLAIMAGLGAARWPDRALALIKPAPAASSPVADDSTLPPLPPIDDAAAGPNAAPDAAPARTPDRPRAVTPEPAPNSTPEAKSDTPAPAIANVAERRDAPEDEWLVPKLDVNRRPVFSPSFASNGSAVFFHTGGNADASSALMSADASGPQLRVMTILDDGARNYHVQPSPDGRQIAFDSDRDGDRGVYVANRDGSNVHRVSGPGFAAVPTWSPDGQQLAYVRAEPHNARVWNLWLLTLASGKSVRLTEYQYGQPWAASWFPDGRRIAYTHKDRLYILDLQTRQTKSFATPVAGHLLRAPAVSPDGTRVVFQVSHNGMWLLDLTNGSTRCVLQDPTAEEFAWAPDGRHIAFHSRRDDQWGVYVMAKRN